VAAATFSQIQGKVQVKPVGTFDWVEATPRMPLRRNDLVKTGVGSSADITFVDGTTVQVRPDSLITIEEGVEDPSTKSRRVSLGVSSGEVNFSTLPVSGAGAAPIVSTPTAKSYVGSETKAAIRVAQAGDSDIRIFQGSSNVETKRGDRVALGELEGLKVDASGAASAKIILPGMPTLVEPAHQAEISYENPETAATTLKWTRVADAQAYHVVVDSTPYFTQPMFDTAEVRGLQAQVTRLGPGRYFWRVAAVGAGGVEGGFSDFARFSIVHGEAPRAAAPPPLSIERFEVRGNILQLKGRTEPGARVTVNGQRIDVKADGSFNEYLPLENAAQATVTIRVLGLGGGVNEQRRTVTGTT
jgi:hypothetical protein